MSVVPLGSPACRDCVFYRSVGGFYGSYASCDRQRVEKVVGQDPINGHKETRTEGVVDAEEERATIMPWRCGAKGRHFRSRYIEAKVTP